MSGAFYAIGGGNFKNKETLSIDLDIIKETNKTNPRVLYVPVASNFDEEGIHTFKEYYESLGTNVSILYQTDSIESIKEKFKSSDIIYLGGGRTSILYEWGLKIGLKELLTQSYRNNQIIAGMSAGAIIMFEHGLGDKNSYRFGLEDTNFEPTLGLGIFHGMCCPHYQNPGLIIFNDLIQDFNCNGFAIENGAALKIKENIIEVVKEPHSNVFFLDKAQNYKLVYVKNFLELDLKKGW